MRRLIAAILIPVLVLVAAGPWLWRQITSLPSAEVLAARSRERIVTLEVGGMTCNGCAASVQGELNKVSGVSAVAVRYESGQAHVVCGPDVPDSALVGAVRRAGPGFLASVVR